MAINSINSTNDKKGNYIFPAVTAIIGGITGGVLIGNKNQTTIATTSKEILEKDLFELSKNITDSLTEEQRVAVKTINSKIETHKNISVIADDMTKGLFKDSDAITIREYLALPAQEKVKGLLKRAQGLFPDTESAIQDFSKIIEGHEKSITEAGLEVEKAKKALAEAKDEAAKKLAENKLKYEEKNLKGLQIILDANKSELEFVKSAADGKITKEAYKAKIANNLNKNITTKIDETLKTIGEITAKSFSGSKMAIGAVIGLLTGVIIAKLTAKKPD